MKSALGATDHHVVEARFEGMRLGAGGDGCEQVELHRGPERGRPLKCQRGLEEELG